MRLDKVILDKYKQVKKPSKNKIYFIIITILIIVLVILASFLFLYFFVRREIYEKVANPETVILPLNLINMILLCIIAGLGAWFGEFILITIIPKFRKKEILYPRSYSSQKRYLIINLVSALICMLLVTILSYLFSTDIQLMIFEYHYYSDRLLEAIITILTLFVVTPFACFFLINTLKVLLIDKDEMFIGELELICSHLEKLGIEDINELSFELTEQLEEKEFRKEIDELISSLGLLVKKRINSKLITKMKPIEFEIFIFSLCKKDSRYTKHLTEAIQSLLNGKINSFYVAYHEFIRNFRQSKDTEHYYTFSLRKIQIIDTNKLKAGIKDYLLEICKITLMPVVSSIIVIIIGAINLL
ncbi:MAG: hypothetical protein ACTSO7_16830 [Candidatus Heimdallarchaeota archaeon]